MATKLLLEEKGVWFGIDGVLLSGGIAKIFNLPQKGGILVQKVADLSPGAIMGLHGGLYNMEIEGEKLIVGGDIILSILGKKIGNEEQMLDLSQEIKALIKGDKMDLTVMRGGKIVELSYTIPN